MIFSYRFQKENFIYKNSSKPQASYIYNMEDPMQCYCDTYAMT